MGESGWTVRRGKRLRELREARQLTQQELALRVGLSSGAVIAAIEAGDKTPKLSRIDDMAAHLGVTTAELLGDTAPRTTPHMTSTVTGDYNLVQNIDRRPLGHDPEALVAGVRAVLQEALQELARLLQRVAPGTDGPSLPDD